MEAQSVTGVWSLRSSSGIVESKRLPHESRFASFRKGRMYPRVHNNSDGLHMGTLVALRLFLSASACGRQHVGMGNFGACTHIALR
ncbi:MAG: hypothetical protein IPK82_20500 [Polyangiaceae bacterium]|nr:hypothetical protein [Polyangiaceae bacterium]